MMVRNFVRTLLVAYLPFAGICGIFPRPASAQSTATWLNAADGSWNDPLNWSSNPGFPNNAQPNPADEYDVVISPIGGNYIVSLPAGITTIDSLSIASPNAS